MSRNAAMKTQVGCWGKLSKANEMLRKTGKGLRNLYLEQALGIG